MIRVAPAASILAVELDRHVRTRHRDGAGGRIDHATHSYIGACQRHPPPMPGASIVPAGSTISRAALKVSAVPGRCSAENGLQRSDLGNARCRGMRNQAGIGHQRLRNSAPMSFHRQRQPGRRSAHRSLNPPSLKNDRSSRVAVPVALPLGAMAMLAPKFSVKVPPADTTASLPVATP